MQKNAINSILYTLNEIYVKYFISEFDNEANYINNLQNYLKFCKDFEILPFILNETQIITYYYLVVGNNELYKFVDLNNTENDSNFFSLNNFILFFVHLAFYYYAKQYESVLYYEENATEIYKLLILLEKLECSKGMRNFVSKSLPLPNNLTFLPNKDILDQMNDGENLNNITNNYKGDEKITTEEEYKNKKLVRAGSSINFYIQNNK